MLLRLLSCDLAALKPHLFRAVRAMPTHTQKASPSQLTGRRTYSQNLSRCWTTMWSSFFAFLRLGLLMRALPLLPRDRLPRSVPECDAEELDRLVERR
jgi:hypothetical protein